MEIMPRTLTILVHEAEEGGYWGEVLELPGCVSQGESLEELRANMREAIEAVLETGLEKLHAEFELESNAGEIRGSSENFSAVHGSPIPETGTWTESHG
jgi:predicted RNase H-like HicB family nuclease